jgi:molybdopterin converting factor subunit 1
VDEIFKETYFMKIKILAFGIAKDIMKGPSIELEIGADTDAAQLKNQLKEIYPELKKLRSFMIAINSEYANASEPISEGDEVALIPPVSGG